MEPKGVIVTIKGGDELLLLELNGAELRTTDEEIVAVFLAIAAGQVSRQDIEQWFEQRVVFTQEPSA